MEDNNLIFTFQQPSQQIILQKHPNQLQDEPNQSGLYHFEAQKFKKEHKLIESQVIQIRGLNSRENNQKNQDLIVFDYIEEDEQNKPKYQFHQKKIKKLKKEIAKQISTQEQVGDQKSDGKQGDLQNKFSFTSLSKKSIIQKQAILQESDYITQEQIQSTLHPIYRPKGKMLDIKSEFYIERILFFPRKFRFYIGQNHKITARRKIFHSSSLYYFFSDRENLSTKDLSYLGYMQSNFNGTQYTVFSKDGINLLYVTYIVNQKTPLETKIYLPKIIDPKQSKTIIKRYKQNDPNIFIIKNKKPVLNSSSNKYSLNLKGRAKMPSIKNCVIQLQNQYSLIFGKQKQRHYALQFGTPFSQFTAFAFCISNYQDKLSNIKE